MEQIELIESINKIPLDRLGGTKKEKKRILLDIKEQINKYV